MINISLIKDKKNALFLGLTISVFSLVGFFLSKKTITIYAESTLENFEPLKEIPLDPQAFLRSASYDTQPVNTQEASGTDALKKNSSTNSSSAAAIDPPSTTVKDHNSLICATHSKESVKNTDFFLKRGENFTLFLERIGLTPFQALEVSMAFFRIVPARKIKSNQKISLKRDENGDISVVDFGVFKSHHVFATKNAKNFLVKKEKVLLKKSSMRLKGSIARNFYETALAMKVPHRIIDKAIHALRYNINLHQGIHDGDALEIAYEVYQDPSGTIVKTGNLTFLLLGKVKIDHFEQPKAVHCVAKQGDLLTQIDRFSSSSCHRSSRPMLQNPLGVGALLRVNSTYGVRRHPLRGYTHVHKGIDFRASYGDQIVAAADGVVTKKCYWGGYGNCVEIRHTNLSYTTRYAHLSRFAHIAVGSHVKQGQVIGFAGSTGSATGVHLHYEVLKNGVHINPLLVNGAHSFALQHDSPKHQRVLKAKYPRRKKFKKRRSVAAFV